MVTSDSGADAEFFKGLLDEVQDAIWVSEADDRLVYTNRSMERILCGSSEDLAGKSVLDILPLCIVEQFTPHFEQIRQTLKTVCFEVCEDVFVGSEGLSSVTLTPRMEGDRFAGMVCRVTERVAHDQGDDELTGFGGQLRAILNSTQQPFVLIAPDYTIRAFNQAAAETTRTLCDRDIMAGQSILEYILPGDEASFLRHFDKAILGESVVVERQVPGGRWFSFAFRPIRSWNSEVIGVCFNTSDISKRKQAEEILHENHGLMETAEELNNSGAWELDFTVGRSKVSENWRRILGVENTHVGWEEFQALIHPDDRMAVEKAFSDALAQGASYEMEHRIVRRQDGECIHVHCRGEVVRDGKGRPLRIVGVSQDVTERKLAEEALARRLRFDQAVAAASTCLLSIETSEAVVTDALTPLLEASGVSRVYIFENFNDPGDGLCMRQTFEVCATGVPPEVDNPALRHVVYSKGFDRWREILSAGDVLRGNSQDFPDNEREVLEPQGIISILVLPIVVREQWWGFIGFDETREPRDWQDTEVALLRTAAEMLGAYFARLETEEVLRRNAGRLQAVIDILQHDCGSMQEFLDYSLDKAIDITASKIGYIYFYDEEQRVFTLNSWSKDVMKECAVVNPQTCYELDKTGVWGEAVRQRKPIILNDFQTPHPHRKGYPEGHVHLMRFLTIPIFHRGRIVAVAGVANKEKDYDETDILELTLLMDAVWKSAEAVRSEDALKRERAMLARTEALAHVGSWEWEVQGDNLAWSDELFRIHGFEPAKEAPSSAEYQSLLVSEDRARLLQAVEDCMTNGVPYALEVRVTRSDGVLRHCFAQGFPERGEDGVVRCLYGSLQDITEIRRAEERIALLSRMLDEASASITIHDTDGCFVFANAATVALHGYGSMDEFMKTNLHDLDVPDSEALLVERFRKISEEGEARFEVEHYRKDGSRFPLEVLAKLIQWEGRAALLSIATDITERRRAEEALRESEETHRALVEGLPDIVMRFDREGRHLFVSDNVRRIVDIEPERFIGRTHAELGFPEAQSRFWEEAIRQVFDSGAPLNTEFRFDGKSGSFIYDWRVLPERDTRGAVSSVLSISRDITAHRKAEQEYKTLFNEMLDGFALHEIILDAPGTPVDYRFLAVNPAFERMTGLKAEAIVGRTVLEVLPGTERHWIETFGNVALSGEPVFFENHSSEFDKHFEVTAFRPAPGQFACIFQDITERKRTEKELERERTRLRALWSVALMAEADLKTISDHVLNELAGMTASQYGFYGFLNEDESLMTIHSWSGEAMKDCSMVDEPTEFIIEEAGVWGEAVRRGEPLILNDYAAAHPAKTGLPEGHVPLTNLLVVPFFSDGRMTALAAVANKTFDYDQGDVNQIMAFLSSVQGIVQARKTQAALHESEARHASMVANISDVIGIIGVDGIMIYKSPNIEKWFGWKPDDLVGTDGWLTVHPNDLERIQKEFYTLLEKDKSVTTVEYRYKCKDGHYTWIELTATNLIHDPLIGGVLLNYHDITEHRKAEEAQRNSEEKFRLAFMTSPDSINVNRMSDGRYIEVNSGFLRIIGYRREEVIGRTSLELNVWKNPEDRETLVKGLQADGYVENLSAQFCRADGTVREGLMSACVVELNGEQCILSITRDVTEHKQAEAEREKLQSHLNQAQKMESVGRLAGGVAHDFNNMLNVILANVEMVIDDLPQDSPLATDLHEAQRAAERSASLTRQLLAFARKQTIAPKVIDLNNTIGMMLKMLERLIGENVELIWKPGGNVEPVLMDPGQLDQMLANLVVNARDAIAGFGAITIESRHAEFSEEYCDVHPGAVSGGYVEVAVSDTGQGMDEETKAQIFEPFFTTKNVGEGTGLGLATVYGIVKQNKGFVNVYSELGHGTTFRIYLPVHHGVRGCAEAGDASSAASIEGRETILVVEDEPAILSTSTRMLERLGYHVLGASSPRKALQQVQEFPEQIDLLITDIVMPEMNGRELAERLKSVYPEINCLFMSGYTADLIAHQGVLEDGVNFIAKPFGRQALGQKVREVLDHRA